MAAPTVSSTASTRSGSRAPAANTCARPARRPAPSGLVARRDPDPEPGGPAPARRAPWRRRRPHPGSAPCRPAADPMDEQHPVRGQPGGRQAGGLGEGQLGRLVQQVRGGHPTCGQRAREALEAASGEGSWSRRPGVAGSPITGWTTTSRPSAVTPAASQPRIIGSRSAGSPTPRSEKTSWWLRLPPGPGRPSSAGLGGSICRPERASGPRHRAGGVGGQHGGQIRAGARRIECA